MRATWRRACALGVGGLFVLCSNLALADDSYKEVQNGQDQSVVSLFKLDADGVNATRAKVKLGRTSVNTVEIVSGLKEGDQVILSDMSQYDAFDRVRLK